jgi:hypothetical protein
MNSPFKLNDLCDNTWSVTWPTFQASNNYDNMAFDILSFVFSEVKPNRVGIGVTFDNYFESDTSILWVDSDVYTTDITAEYSQYLYKNYKIFGAVFEKQQDAEKFKDLIEKRHVWQLLKA